MTILLVEDEKDSIDSCIEYAKGDRRKVNIEVAKNFDEVYACLEKDIDAAIVDIRLETDTTAGNKVIEEINKLSLRLPTVVHTGTPSSVQADVLKVFTKGEHTYKDIFDYLFSVSNTGIMNILGRKGILEKKLQFVYMKNVLPIMNDSWIKYGEIDPLKTERGLLRYILNHLQQSFDTNDDSEKFFPEEMYIYPPLTEDYLTGSIVNKKNNNNKYIILSPACDLALHGPERAFKTERILLAEIKDISEIIKQIDKKNPDEDERNKRKACLFRNNHALYYHWLPKTAFFDGGLINFRRLSSFKKKELVDIFSKPIIQISPLFCKDIVSRFSSYYARQGQPDIDIDLYIKTSE